MSKNIRPLRPMKSKNSYNVAIERVLGFTATNNCSVALDAKNSVVFYTAGCVVVGESCETNTQFIVQSPTRKSLTCLDVSSDGKYIITGESGHQPMVRVWSGADGRQLGALGSHHFRISSVRLSPGPATYIVSIGCQEDQTICVWDRVQFQKVASAKVSARVNAVAFADEGDFFVTVGIRHVRFWYLDLKKRSKVKETQPLKGRNAVLGDMLHNTFTDVCCCLDPAEPGGALTLVLSQAGQLLQINAIRCVTKWVDLKVSSAVCMALSRQIVAVGCASSVCLLFSAVTLRFIARVPLPHPLGASIISSKVGVPSSAMGSGHEVSYAEVAAIKLDLSKGLLVCLYADHRQVSIIQYFSKVFIMMSSFPDNFTRPLVFRVVLFVTIKVMQQRTFKLLSPGEVRAICGGAATSFTSSLSSTPDETDIGRWIPAGVAGGSALHVEYFVTCSDDDTVRIWPFPVNRSTLKPNELFPDGKEEVSVLYTDSSYANLCTDERGTNGFGPTYFGQGSTLNLSAPGSPSPMRQVSTGRWSSNANILAAQNGAGFGLRSIAISSDARHFAIGDRSGQLRIYDFNTFKLLHSIRAHDAEILSIAYFESKLMPGMSLLCTSSRDRVIHVFAPRQDYSRVQTLADHSGVVNSALFYECEETRSIYLISCGADRSLLFRVLSTDPESQTARFVIEHHITVTHSYACATVVGPSILSPPTPAGSNVRMSARPRYHLAVACQDRQLRLYQITKARQLFNYRGSTSEEGSPVCCAADPTSTLIATAGSDKQINLFHLFTGEHVATLYGHADIIMGLLFLPDLRHLVSMSYDSCIFIWRLAPELTALMQDRQQRVTAALNNTLPIELPSFESPSPINGSPTSSLIRPLIDILEDSNDRVAIINSGALLTNAILLTSSVSSFQHSLLVGSYLYDGDKHRCPYGCYLLAPIGTLSATRPRFSGESENVGIHIDPKTALRKTPNDAGNHNLAEKVKFCFNETDLPSWARGRQHAESDTEISATKHNPPGRKVKRSLTGLLGPITVAAKSATTHVYRSNSDCKRTSLASKHHHYNHTLDTVPTDYPSRGSSLSRLPSTGNTLSHGPEESMDTDDNQGSSPMATSAVFPRWASSVVDISEESPFEPPSDSPVGQNHSPNPVEANLSLTTSLSTDILSNPEDLTVHHQSNNVLMTRSQIDDYCPKLSRVEELCDSELERLGQGTPRKRSNAQVSSARASWSEPDTETVISARTQEDDSSLAQQPMMISHVGGGKPSGAARSAVTHSHSSDDVENLTNPVSSTSELPTALSLLSNVREAIDAAVEHFTTTDYETIRESQEFYRTHLEWRVTQLRNILQVDSPLSFSTHPESTTTPIAASTELGAKQQQQVEEAAVTQLIDRLMPSIRSAMAETLTGGAPSAEHTDRRSLKISADPLPAD
ncbi:hypothetical protein Aperf_G00000033098 [Anoplocephala perfoliata]